MAIVNEGRAAIVENHFSPGGGRMVPQAGARILATRAADYHLALNRRLRTLRRAWVIQQKKTSYAVDPAK